MFAQTIVEGKNEGVNAFLVRIRSDALKEQPGVTIQDMGWKMGLNGVDNALLKFKDVKVPREALLNRLADVTAEGKFVCPTEKAYARFFEVTAKLITGRMCLASLNIGAVRSCLYIAITYARQRMGVGATGESDMPIYNF